MWGVIGRTVSAPPRYSESAAHLWMNSISASVPMLSMHWDRKDGVCRFSRICCLTNSYGWLVHCFNCNAIRFAVSLKLVPGTQLGTYLTDFYQTQNSTMSHGHLQKGRISTIHLPGTTASVN
jgi:hypothetical protein